MRLGAILVPTQPWARTAQDFRWAEQTGYDVAYIYDHLTHPTVAGRWLAHGFTTLTAAASVTSSMRLGTLVASATLHSPVMLARLAATVDDVSGGRLVLGLGAGSPRCALADRDEDPSPAEMSHRLADVVEGFGAVFAGATEWRGRTMSFSGLETTPMPEGAHRPELVLAAHGPRAMELTARHADGWNTYGGPAAAGLEPEDFWAELARQAGRMTEACERVGRDPATLRRSVLLGYGTVRPADSANAYQDALARAETLGFTEVVVYAPMGEPGERFWSDPEVHAEVLGSRAD
jgi:alkanesulfonate monooxygenase SsuD/methylene tetrahydromethanopterin reductase-like flavin-dependent oxidoreductase (luciferase family)